MNEACGKGEGEGDVVREHFTRAVFALGKGLGDIWGDHSERIGQDWKKGLEKGLVLGVYSLDGKTVLV